MKKEEQRCSSHHRKMQLRRKETSKQWFEPGAVQCRSLPPKLLYRIDEKRHMGTPPCIIHFV